jgi:mannose-1-phosphate guanylyltransferase/mannose-6-phosphate isomerase
MYVSSTCRLGPMLEAARNCYVRSDGMLAAVVGLTDAVLVVTKDAVLAMHRDHAQHVKKVVDRLKAAGGMKR